MNKLYFSKRNSNLVVEYPFEFEEWFKQIFHEIAQAYYYSATRDSELYLSEISKPIYDLIKKYYEDMEIAVTREKWLKSGVINKITQTAMDKNKIVIAMSGGKDCIHLALRLIEKGSLPNDILAVYVENLNRSESFYEKQAIKAVCEKMGIRFHILQVKNSIKVNRTGHNIGFREQLISTLLIPFMLKHGATDLYFGNKIQNRADQIWCTKTFAFDKITERFLESGISFRMNLHPDTHKGITDVDITIDLLRRYRDYLDISSSCYAQQNFKEKKNANLQSKVPEFKLYNGCGHCQKCVIINGCIYMESPVKSAYLKKHLQTKFEEKFPDNHDIKYIMEKING